MRSQMKLLSLTVRATVILLTAGAFLVVLGIFDDFLDWDIFSPEVERLLRGAFAACVSLGGFGAAICVVLGIQEVVRAFRKLVSRDEPVQAEAPRRSYVVALAAVLLLLIVAVTSLGALNRRVEAHRLKVFKLIVRDQMAQLGPPLAAEVARIPAPCVDCATPVLRELSFCRSATLYLPDPGNDTVLWRYPDDPSNPPKLERFFIAKDDDRAVSLALQGDTAWIDLKNAGPGFVWHHVVKDGQGKTRAVLQIWGDESESFREYEAVAEAAERRAGKK
jgi:hypothetical protein